VRQVLNPIWNTWSFLTLYGRIDGVRGRVRTDQQGLLDRYALAKTRALVEQVTAAMEAYDLAGACAAVTSYLDALTTWYVRRSRQRFWRAGGSGPDKADAYDTLHTVLEVLCRVVAPLLPFLSEEIYRGLTGERSVHLAGWPALEELPDDPELVRQMDLVREICSEGHSIRKARGLRARLPLRMLTVAAPGASGLAEYEDLLRDELNVKEVVLTEDVGAYAEEVLSVVPAALGPRLGPDTQRVIVAAKRGEWERRGDATVVGGVELLPGEHDLRLRPRDESAARALPGRAGVAVLDVETTPELEAEGLARDVVRLIQQQRKDAGFEVSDRIRCWIWADDEALRAAIGGWSSYVREQTLVVEDGLQTIHAEAVDDELPALYPAADAFRFFELPGGHRIGLHLLRA
jgi:isoleucyl-tRNA synthetase